jgi:hypothetical protein
MRNQGFNPSEQDARDYPIRKLLARHTSLIIEPTGSANLSKYVIDVLDQKNLGSCVFQGLAQQIRISAYKEEGVEPALASRLYAYYNTRSIEKTVSGDAGAMPRNAIKAINEYGWCKEIDWPYNILKFNKMPPFNAYRLAFDSKERFEYYFIRSSGAEKIKEVKLALDAGFPVGIGTQIGKDYFNYTVKSEPLKPPITEWNLGGHYMVLTGYENAIFNCLGSWGSVFGKKGWVDFTEEYIEWYQTTDLLVITKAPRITE